LGGERTGLAASPDINLDGLYDAVLRALEDTRP